MRVIRANKESNMGNKLSYTKRKETKYFVNYGQYMLLKSLLESVFDKDKFSNNDGYYFVRSVYFDTLQGKDFNEKEVGISHRRKIRFRYYNESPNTIKLEVKEKINKHTIKESIHLSKEEAIEVFQGDYTCLIDKYSRLYEHLTTYAYKPSTIVDYEREAYINDAFNLRINFDMNIRGTKLTEGYFEANLPTFPLIDPVFYVLEVKHDGHVPDFIQDILSSVDLTNVTYSKYYYSNLI